MIDIQYTNHDIQINNPQKKYTTTGDELTIQNIEKIRNVGSSINKWHISGVDERIDVYKDVYAFFVSIDGKYTSIFYLNRESQWVSGRNEPVYRLYKDFDQTKINRWLSKNQITLHCIGNLIHDMLKE